MFLQAAYGFHGTRIAARGFQEGSSAYVGLQKFDGLAEYADTSKLELQKIVREGLDYLRKELS